MSTPDKQQRKDEDPETPDAKVEEAAPKDAGADAPGKGMKYVFKISPADPKNNFDFEDVADK